MSLVQYQEANDYAAGGFSLYYLANPAAGATTISVAVSASQTIAAGSVSYTGSSGLGTAVSAGSPDGASGSVTIPSTTTGGMCVFGGSYGGAGGDTFSGNNSTIRWQNWEGYSTAASNGCGGDAPSTGSSVTLGYNTNGSGDAIALVGVELKPSAPVGSANAVSLALALPRPFLSLNGVSGHAASANFQLPVLGMSLSAKVTRKLGFNIALPAPSVSISGKSGHTAEFDFGLPIADFSFAASTARSLVFGVELPLLRANITGVSGHSMSFNVELPPPQPDIVAGPEVPEPVLTFNVMLPPGTPKSEDLGLNLVLPVPVLEFKADSPILIGFSIELDAPVLDLHLDSPEHLELDLNLPVPVLLFSGKVPAHIDAVLAFQLPRPGVIFSGDCAHTISLNLDLSVPEDTLAPMMFSLPQNGAAIVEVNQLGADVSVDNGLSADVS
jgi:hypothetical protein